MPRSLNQDIDERVATVRDGDRSSAEYFGNWARLEMTHPFGRVGLAYEFARLAAHHALDYLTPPRKLDR